MSKDFIEICVLSSWRRSVSGIKTSCESCTFYSECWFLNKQPYFNIFFLSVWKCTLFFQYSHSYVRVSMDAHSNTHLHSSCLVTRKTDTFSRREESSGEIVKWALMGGHAIDKKLLFYHYQHYWSHFSLKSMVNGVCKLNTETKKELQWHLQDPLTHSIFLYLWRCFVTPRTSNNASACFLRCLLN